MRAPALILLASLALAACKPSGPEGGDLPLVGQEKQDAEKFECVARGGNWVENNGGWICQRVTKDAGKACRASSDCEGACLARSRTCAPVTPLLGCNEVLTEAGFPMQTCVQ
ncbi:MAG: hypothetical protein H5U24_07195 [Thioclava marina]|jgi:hypothetical protein|uniref:Lipoprotein n=1 Tax=Thioclava marina TaxID=1915077 RepID=A0ABX3MPA0_9RHOB|nr:MULTISPECIES: hypothetical protein [Thioclava]TNE88054.1 MAG: hypothetical protein EP337_10355 [Paracoccaceae bacterium]MBC7145176.1 hypothetical protein [Thioclava marina]MBD3803996.1 hypothetical protein [Thioclava sp.]OOY13376.1 hypothetical protein BMG00_06235 [Thioclava marina]OOY29088.1 hypothetical protein BMI90_02140 [Thioclava sp. L04-15]